MVDRSYGNEKWGKKEENDVSLAVEVLLKHVDKVINDASQYL